MSNILEQIREQVNNLSADEVRAQLLKMQEAKAKQRERQKGKKAGPLSDEAKAKRTEYNRSRMAKPEVKEKMKAYRMKPETIEKRKAYTKKRRETQNAIIARAKELGLVSETGELAQPSA